jgi:hypothetical protein
LNLSEEERRQQQPERQPQQLSEELLSQCVANANAACIPLYIKEHNGAEQLASGMLSGGVRFAMTLSRDPTALVVRMVGARYKLNVQVEFSLPIA